MRRQQERGTWGKTDATNGCLGSLVVQFLHSFSEFYLLFERQSDTEIISISVYLDINFIHWFTASLPRWPQQSRLSQANEQSLTLHPVLPWVQAPMHLGLFCCFLTCMSWELDLK